MVAFDALLKTGIKLMDIWVLIAEHLLRHNPNCQAKKRRGALLACVSKLHKDAVDVALRMNWTQGECSRPIVTSYHSQFHDKTLRFCKTCFNNFECDDPTGRLSLVTEICPCVDQLDRLIRFTICLTTINRAECLHCGEEEVLDDYTVVQLLHHQACGGCLRGPPDMCRACYYVTMHY